MNQGNLSPLANPIKSDVNQANNIGIIAKRIILNPVQRRGLGSGLFVVVSMIKDCVTTKRLRRTDINVTIATRIDRTTNIVKL